jgi:translation initiation factor 1A
MSNCNDWIESYFAIAKKSVTFDCSNVFFLIISSNNVLITNSGNGGKNRRRGKGDGEESKRELEFKEEGQEYAQVVKMLGNGRCECFCFDGVTRLGHIRGKMRKKVWITAGDIVLVGKRDFQDEKVDILHKYTADEARNLKQYGELPETARINETAVDLAMTGDAGDDDIGIDFDDI